jgi:hypothetical protein
MVSIRRRLDSPSSRIRALIRSIEDNDEARIEEAVPRLSSSRRVLAPLALAVGAFALLFNGLRLLVSNWRLTLVHTPGDVDLAGHVRPEAPRAAREIVSRLTRPNTDPDRAGHHGADRGQLRAECGSAS